MPPLRAAVTICSRASTACMEPIRTRGRRANVLASAPHDRLHPPHERLWRGLPAFRFARRGRARLRPSRHKRRGAMDFPAGRPKRSWRSRQYSRALAFCVAAAWSLRSRVVSPGPSFMFAKASMRRILGIACVAAFCGHVTACTTNVEGESVNESAAALEPPRCMRRGARARAAW